MEHDDSGYPIGELARRTGLTVKAIRYYSDQGLVPPVSRSPAGYRRYDTDAVARLSLVRTLRDLGVDLATIRKVLAREVTLADLAVTHTEALTAQIRLLQLQRAVLRAVAERGGAELASVHRLARLTAEGRRRLVDDFLDSVFGGLAARPEFVGISRSMTPQLPDDPTAEQVEAWLELAELVEAPDFRAVLRQLAEQHAAEQSSPPVRRDVVAMIRDEARPALAAGIDPASAAADPVVAAALTRYAETIGKPVDAGLRERLLARLELANDQRRERYLALLARVNGWATDESSAPALTWFTEALHARPQPSRR